MTLTDVAEDERWAGLSTRLQTNLQRNARASGVEAIVSVAPLDWEVLPLTLPIPPNPNPNPTPNQACVADDYPYP